jgi:ribonuclease-3
MSAKGRRHVKLEARLGYRFADPDLLDRALTHSSALSPGTRTERSYQRLEFLGDRVLGLVVADMLYRLFPKASEGELNRTLVTLVRGESCAAIARQLDLSAELHLGESERRIGSAENDSILADAAEAVIGAIFCDGGLGQAYAFIERMLGDNISHAVALRPDAKTTLQEWAQGQGLEPPTYTVAGKTGPQHEPEFTIEVNLKGHEPLRASGSSKKLAEHKAAEGFLIRERVWKETL